MRAEPPRLHDSVSLEKTCHKVALGRLEGRSVAFAGRSVAFAWLEGGSSERQASMRSREPDVRTCHGRGKGGDTRRSNSNSSAECVKICTRHIKEPICAPHLRRQAGPGPSGWRNSCVRACSN